MRSPSFAVLGFGLTALFTPQASWAQTWSVSSPDRTIRLAVTLSKGTLHYTATRRGAVMLEDGCTRIAVPCFICF